MSNSDKKEREKNLNIKEKEIVSFEVISKKEADTLIEKQDRGD